jgi:hypothetical protein
MENVRILIDKETGEILLVCADDLTAIEAVKQIRRTGRSGLISIVPRHVRTLEDLRAVEPENSTYVFPVRRR